jgi:hypothetical protein
MKCILMTLFVAGLISIAVPAMAQSHITTADDARTVATNWTALIEYVKGDWGGQAGATVADVERFTRGERLLGYFCRIEPRGYIVVSLQKNLAPVKAYSATCTIDPHFDKGMTDLIKLKMEGILDAIESRLGPIDQLKAGRLEAILDIDYADSWTFLNRDTNVFRSELAPGQKINYQEGGILLEAVWHQGAPYNDQCPDHGCGVDTCIQGDNAVVGCLATSAAQILHHWHWPPYGSGGTYSDTYDWPNMPDSFIGCAWDDDEVNAVAELCHEAGLACSMDYGCNGSSAYYVDMESGYEGPFRISDDCRIRYRSNFDWPEWWDMIKGQLNANRPMQYAVKDHSIVCDGWRVASGINQYHMNYGWGGAVPNPVDYPEWAGYTNSNTWFVLDALIWGGIQRELMIVNIFPDVAVGPTPSGTYSLQAFPYRYVDRDATSDDAYFAAGQHIQFLPNVTLTGTSTTGGQIRIEGMAADNTILFTRGDESISIRIAGGAFTLRNGGAVVFR